MIIESGDFEIGDIVEVTDAGRCYPNYEALAREAGLKNWFKGNELTRGVQGVIVNELLHSKASTSAYTLTRDKQVLCIDVNGRDYMIGFDGVKLIKRKSKNHFGEDLFKL